MIFYDFEYRNKYETKDIVFVSFYNATTKVMSSFRGSDRVKIKAYVEGNLDSIFFCFTANADLPCLITCGIDIRKLRFVDLHMVYLQLTYTYPKYYTEKPSLINALSAMGLDGGYIGDEKVDTVALILESTVYSEPQWAIIKNYCEKDTKCLPSLAGLLFKELGTLTRTDPVDVLTISEYHGEYLKAVAWADYHNRGFPVNEERLNDIYSNISLVKEKLALDCNREYCEDQYTVLYRHDVTNHRNDTRTDKYTFSIRGFTELLERKGLYSMWPKTPTGKVSKKGDIIEANLKGAPYLMKLYRTLKTFHDLSSKKDLRDLCFEGYIKGNPTGFWMAKPYGTKTFRTSPLPANGFILNKTPWMRVALIEPKQGKVIVSADWAAQEIAISASLSKDDRLRELYEQKKSGGDIYLFMAIKAGSAPEGATKQTHGAIRDMFKVVLLGLSYGMGVKTLGASLYKSRIVDGTPTISSAEALESANEISTWHREYFCKFWEWVDLRKDMAYSQGYMQTLDGLFHFVTIGSRPTAVQNFPVQSAAAAMMRAAFVRLVKEDLDVICSLHDAFYITCNEVDANIVAKTLERCMAEASMETIGDFCPVLAESKIQHHGSWFDDDRADAGLKVIKPLFGWD